jgi:hypothetical protein
MASKGIGDTLPERRRREPGRVLDDHQRRIEDTDTDGNDIATGPQEDRDVEAISFMILMNSGQP